MASHPGYNVADYVGDVYFNITEEEEKFIAEVYEANENAKSFIEHFLSEYDEETQSWRDYRNAYAQSLDENFPNERLLIRYYLQFGPLQKER